MGESKLEKLRDTEFYKPIYEQLYIKYSGNIPKDIGDHVVELAQKSDNRIKNIINWVSRTCIIIDELLYGNTNEAEYPQFWIHIYEIIFQFYTDENKNRKINELISFKKTILIALDNIREKLTEEELILITFMRHSGVHIYLDSIWSKLKKKNDEILKIIPPKLPDAILIAQKFINENGGSQKKLAFKFALKLKDDICDLKVAVNNAI